MRLDLGAGGSWAGNAVRSMPTRVWIISLASLFVITLPFIYHSHLPPLSWSKHHPHPPPPPEGGPPPPAPPVTAPPGKDGLKVWEPPDMDPLVHGVHASDGIKRKPTYPLIPFPPSPMTNPPQRDDIERPWLGAVICAAWDIERRMLIRYTWMKLFKNVPMDHRFVVSNPGPHWTDIVSQENKTYGDMIVLEHLPEDDFTANTVKTIEFYRWLVDNNQRYEFVSKMDTDLFVNARAMYDQKLLPRLESTPAGLRATVNYTTIGQFYYDSYHHASFPHGAIYTVTWDVVELLPKLQDQYHIIAGEDVTMAWLLMKGKQKVTMVVLSEAEKFEFDRTDMRPTPPGWGRTPWAREETDVTSSWHAMHGSNILAIHQLKKDDDWLMVTQEFNETGVKEMPPYPKDKPKDDGPKPSYPRPYWTKIPDDYWEVDYDGTFLCNGIWKLEPGVGRDMKKKE